MIKNTTLCLLITLIFFACNRNNKQTSKINKNLADTLKSKEVKDSSASPAVKEEKYFDYSNTVIKEAYNDTLYTKFSDLSLDDKFTLNIPEGNINQTKSFLRIFNNAGEMIYEKSFQTSELIYGYDLAFIKTDEEVEKHILDRAKEILSLNSFIDISDKNEIIKEDGILNQSPDAFENYKVFQECQKDKRPLFCIGLAEEDITYLGYSQKLNKVVDIIYCC